MVVESGRPSGNNHYAIVPNHSCGKCVALELYIELYWMHVDACGCMWIHAEQYSLCRVITAFCLSSCNNITSAACFNF